jgi:hypothetical protein
MTINSVNLNTPETESVISKKNKTKQNDGKKKRIEKKNERGIFGHYKIIQHAINHQNHGQTKS